MTLQNYLRILREQWVLVVSAVALAVLVAWIFAAVQPPEYKSKVTLYVSAQAQGSVDAAYQGAQLAQQRVASYVELVDGPGVTREVVEQARLDITPEQVAERISASSPPESVLVNLAATGPSPKTAATVANAAAHSLVDVVAKLERPSSPDAVAPLAIRVVQQATLPTAPSSPRLMIILIFGLLVGLTLGAAAALARNALDTSIKSREQLQDAAPAPILGTLAYGRHVPQRPLTVHEDPQSPRAESFRQLRANLQFVDINNPPTVIAVTSSLSGEGKTNTLCNLAIALGSAGSKTLVIEADLRQPTLSNLLNLDGSTGLTSVLAAQVSLHQAIQPCTEGRFDVLSSGTLPPNPGELLASKNMADLLATLRDRYDVVLVDTPPLLRVADAAAVAPASDGAILICRYKKTRQSQVRSAAKALEAVATPLLGTVLTMLPSPGAYGYAHSGVSQADKRVILPRRLRLPRARLQERRRPPVPDSR